MRDERVAAPGDRVHQGTLVRVEGCGVPHHRATFRQRGVEPVQPGAQDVAVGAGRPANRAPRAARRVTRTHPPPGRLRAKVLLRRCPPGPPCGSASGTPRTATARSPPPPRRRSGCAPARTPPVPRPGSGRPRPPADRRTPRAARAGAAPPRRAAPTTPPAHGPRRPARSRRPRCATRRGRRRTTSVRARPAVLVGVRAVQPGVQPHQVRDAPRERQARSSDCASRPASMPRRLRCSNAASTPASRASPLPPPTRAAAAASPSRVPLARSRGAQQRVGVGLGPGPHVPQGGGRPQSVGLDRRVHPVRTGLHVPGPHPLRNPPPGLGGREAVGGPYDVPLLRAVSGLSLRSARTACSSRTPRHSTAGTGTPSPRRKATVRYQSRTARRRPTPRTRRTSSPAPRSRRSSPRAGTPRSAGSSGASAVGTTSTWTRSSSSASGRCRTASPPVVEAG